MTKRPAKPARKRKEPPLDPASARWMQAQLRGIARQAIALAKSLDAIANGSPVR